MVVGKHYDVIVVGAGPSGTSAAKTLAVQGVDVLIVERQRWPRRKLCGGGLTPKTYREIGREIEDLVERKCGGVDLRAGKSGPFHIQRDDLSIWMVDRQELDVRLLERARGEGAQFIDGQAVRRVKQSNAGVAVVTENETHRARVVIAADGFDSVVAKDVGLRRDRNARYFLALQTEIRPRRDVLGAAAVVDFGFPYGYAWAFPKGEHYSVGVGTADAKRFRELPAYLDRFIAASGLGGEPRTQYRGHKIPFGGAKERLDSGSVVVVGDAAGMADPLFGEGISYSIKSGQMAGDVVARYLNGKVENLSPYTTLMHRTIVKDMQALRRVAFVVHRFPGLAVRLLSSSHWLQDMVAAVISGERSKSGIWRQGTDVETSYTLPLA